MKRPRLYRDRQWIDGWVEVVSVVTDDYLWEMRYWAKCRLGALLEKEDRCGIFAGTKGLTAREKGEADALLDAFGH
jgi:hypothetical protein